MNKQEKQSTVPSSRSLPYKTQKTNSQSHLKKQTEIIKAKSVHKNQQDHQTTNMGEYLSNTVNGCNQKDLHLNLLTSDANKGEGSSQRGLQSQSTASAVEKDNNNIEKFNDSESQFGAVGKQSNIQQSKDQSIDYKEASDNQNSNGSAFKTFSFVSVVMEPCRKNTKSMKARDKNKPLIETSIINKQIRFMNQLVEYQRQNYSPLPIEFDEMRDVKIGESKKKKKSGLDDSNSKIIRGNLGFCYLDMSLINLCGIPSLWMDQRQFATAGSKIKTNDTDVFDPYLKPFQKNLLKKQYKVYSLIRFHKIFENDKYFGKNISLMFNQGCQNIIVDYWQFSTENLKETNKYHQQQTKLMQKFQENFSGSKINITSSKDRKHVLHIIQGSQDSISLDIPRIVDADPAYFKLINSEAKILKQILFSQNIQQTDQNDWNLLWTSITLQQRPQIYEQLHDYQKINHFMNSIELTRKDRFADNIANIKTKFGSNHFEFVPETFQFPEELSLFQQRFNQVKFKLKKAAESNNDQSSDESTPKEDNLWIYKPSQSSQGKGIYILSELTDLQKDLERGVICRYISNPLLVNQHKFDLRVYVLLTSVDPLRIYVYNEGLARFASSPYDYSKSQIKNLYSHLTNYSINKKSESFSQNKSLEERDHGNKWTISDLQSHLEKLGINMQPIWERIYDAIIKSLISVEHQLLAGCKKIQHSSRPQNCFELFGFDIILDNQFKPYILEVNFSPSLSADSPLDYHIKSNLLVDSLNIVGLKKNHKRRGTTQKNPNLQKIRQNFNANSGVAGYLQMIQAHQRAKEIQRQNGNLKVDYNSFSSFLAQGNVDQYFLDRLSRISAKHRELVYETLDEMQRNKNMNFTCIYPSAGCYQYDRFFEGGGRQSNQLIHRYLFTKNELFSLTKQICDYQKQCIKSKQGEDFQSQSDENEENQEKENSSKHESDQKIQESSSPTYTKTNKLVSEPNIIHEKNEISDSKSNDSNTKSPQKKAVQQEQKQEPRTPQKIKHIQKQQTSDNDKEPKAESIESPNRTVNAFQPSKLLSLESASPTKVTNYSQSNDIETPNKKEYKPLKDLKIEKAIDEKLKTPIPHNNLPDIGIKSNLCNLESKSSVQSPNDRSRENSEPMFSYKNSLSKISNNQGAPSKKDEIQCTNSDQNKSEIDYKSKTRNSNTNDKYPDSTMQTQNFTMATIQPKEDKKQAEPAPKPTEKNQPTLPKKIKDTQQEVIKIQTSSTPMKNKSPEKKQDSFVSIEKTPVSKIENTNEKQASPPKGTEAGEEEKPVEKKKQKMIITGDDILIEYVSRIIRHLESICIVFHKKYNQKIDQVEDILPQTLRNTLERFALHTIWSNKLNSMQKQAPLNHKIRVRHKEMVDRRTKILTTMLKKNNTKIASQEIQEELKTQDTNREKIISRIQSQKIEKMVKQSNVENQIDIVSILVEGSYNLPIFLQVSGGKTTINGTLSSLKIFEKILKSDKVQNLQSNFAFKEQESFNNHTSPQKINNVDFLTDAKPTRENSKLFVSSILGNSSNTQLAYKPHQLQSANKAEKQSLNQTLNQVLPEAQKRRMTNSGSASGYKQSMKNGMMVPIDNNQSYNNSMAGVNNTYIQTGSNEVEDNSTTDQLKYHSISEAPKHKISRQMIAAVHQKNSQSFMSSQNNQNYQPEEGEQKQQSFDKRQRSYRNENHVLSMTYSKNNQDQIMYLQREIQDKIRVTGIQNSGLARMHQNNNYSNIKDPDLNLNSIKNISPDINFHKNAYINQTFSPQSTGPNPKVSSNSAISIVKAGEHLINNNSSFMEFNRSHQGDGFFKKINSFKKSDNYESIQIKGPTEVPPNNNGQISHIKQDGKRGSSHSHQAGGGNRASNFKSNTGNYTNTNLIVHHSNIGDFSTPIAMHKQPQQHNSNNRLMSFDSQQTANRQISNTLNVQTGVTLSKQMQQKSLNAQSKQQLNNGITLPQIANLSSQASQHSEHKNKSLIITGGQNSHKDLSKMVKKQQI